MLSRNKFTGRNNTVLTKKLENEKLLCITIENTFKDLTLSPEATQIPSDLWPPNNSPPPPQFVPCQLPVSQDPALLGQSI